MVTMDIVQIIYLGLRNLSCCDKITLYLFPHNKYMARHVVKQREIIGIILSGAVDNAWRIML